MSAQVIKSKKKELMNTVNKCLQPLQLNYEGSALRFDKTKKHQPKAEACIRVVSTELFLKYFLSYL